MFGYIVPNQSLLSDADKQRFRAAYCGLCRTLRKRHGLIGSATLSYDLTFLALLLGALYEPEESAGEERCITRPVKKHLFAPHDLLRNHAGSGVRYVDDGSGDASAGLCGNV